MVREYIRHQEKEDEHYGQLKLGSYAAFRWRQLVVPLRGNKSKPPVISLGVFNQTGRLYETGSGDEQNYEYSCSLRREPDGLPAKTRRLCFSCRGRARQCFLKLSLLIRRQGCTQYFAGNPGEFSQDSFRLRLAHKNEKCRRIVRNGAAQ